MLVYSNVLDHLDLRRTLKYFETEHPRFPERSVTDEVTSYVETLSNITRTMKSIKSITGTVFMSPPGYMFLPGPIQQFLYQVLEAAYARNLSFYLEASKPEDQHDNVAPMRSVLPRILGGSVESPTSLHRV